jgi:phage repressor protein C with HTH and peptisase S24 domain
MQENNRDFSVLKKRILQYLDIKGISKYECYQNTGITNGVFSQLNGMSEDNMLKFLSYYSDISPEWLLAGTGEMLKSGKKPAIIKVSEGDSAGIPLIPFDAVAGFDGSDNPGVRYEDCERYVVPEFEKSGVEFVVRVSGSSMYPKYSNGDILACRKINNILFFQWGKIYVIDSSSQGILVKRIYEDAKNQDNIILVSDNKEKYPPHPMPKSDIRSLSIVLGVIRME